MLMALYLISGEVKEALIYYRLLDDPRFTSILLPKPYRQKPSFLLLLDSLKSLDFPYLDLSHCNLKEEQFSLVTDFIKTQKNITKINVSDNPLSSLEVNQLIALIRERPITYLNLSGLVLDQDGLLTIKALIERQEASYIQNSQSRSLLCLLLAYFKGIS